MKSALQHRLQGRRILLTAPLDASSQTLAMRLRATGADVTCIPLIETRLLPFDVLALTHETDWLFFTSKNAVYTCFHSLLPGKTSLFPPIAVIGPATAQALMPYDLSPNFMAPVANARAAAEAFLKHLQAGSTEADKQLTIVWPCGNRAYPDLKETLTAGGCRVKPIVVYETLSRQLSEEEEYLIRSTSWDCIVFSSGSAVHAYADLLGSAARPSLYACLGQQTENAVHAARLPGNCFQGGRSDYPALTEAILNRFNSE